MAADSNKQIRSLNFRARLPGYFRVGAIFVLLLTLIAVGIGYYRARSNAEFRMVGFPTELSKDVIATVSGYERRESDGETLKYYIKADAATTFSDNHQELENVYLQIFGEDGTSDEITAGKAVYVPEGDRNFTGYFAGDVVISSHNDLKLRTQQVTYSRSSDIAAAEEVVDFERFNIKGRSLGASLNLGKRQLRLDRNVYFEVTGDNGGFSTLTAGNAVYDQTVERIEMLEGAMLEKHDPVGNARFADSRLKANRVVAQLSQANAGIRVLERVELFENVEFERNENGGVVSMSARNANYSRPADRFELNHEVTARIARGDTVYDGQASKAVYEPGNSRVEFSGGARIQSGDDLISGGSMLADLNPDHTLQKVAVAENAHIRQSSTEFNTEISAPRLTGTFGDDRVLKRADAIGMSEISRTSTNDKTKLTINAASALHSVFRDSEAIELLQTEGRTVVRLDVPDNGADSANRSVAADTVKTVFQSDGKNLRRAEAVGNAEFISTAHRAATANYNIRTNAPRFDCDFFSGRNDPKTCVASNGTKTLRTPTIQKNGRGEQTITSNRLIVAFDERSRAISQLEASGKSKFTELDRTALADSFVFSSGDEVIRLRGGEPTAWDSTARIKAGEIDWDTRNNRSAYRGGVSSTYYSARGVGNASPFGDVEKPFYVTSESAELDHQNEIGTFSGNARGWQGNNYVRGERLELRKRDSGLNAFGGIQSLLYDVKKSKGGTESRLPVFAAAEEMQYDGKVRTIRFNGGVDIRQGSDRMTGGSAFIQMNERMEMAQTTVESNVAISQSGRKAFGDTFVYTASNDRIFLRGRPARVEDVERGASQGEELEIYLSDNRISGEGRSRANPSGRVRNTYKIK